MNYIVGKDCENGDDKKKETPLVQELLKTRTIILSEEVSEDMAKSVYAQATILNERSHSDPITIIINSPGGSADAGFGIYDFLRFVEAPITTVVAGLCASAGVTIFLAADKGRNLSLPNSRFLLHQPSTGIRGDASDIQITADEINKTRIRYNQVVADVTGKDLNTIAADADRDFWMSTEEAKEYGLVSKIITKRDELG